MRLFMALRLVHVAISGSVSGTHSMNSLWDESVILEFNSTTLDALLATHDRLFVNMCIDGKQECIDVEPAFRKAALQAKMNGYRTQFARADILKDPAVAIRFSVTSCPVLLYVKRLANGCVHIDVGSSLTPPVILSLLEDYERPTFDWSLASKPPPVHRLTAMNFTDFLNSHNHVVVKFFSVGCGRCSTYAPVYEMAARRAQREELATVFAEVEVNEDRELAQRLEVVSYPSLLYFSRAHGREGVDKGEAVRGEVAADATTLVGWAAQKENLVRTFSTEEHINTWSLSKRFALMVSLRESSKHMRILKDVASELAQWSTEFSFAVFRSADHARSSNLSLRRRNVGTFDQESVAYRGSWTRKGIKAFVLENSYPSIGDYDAEPKKYIPRKESSDFFRAALIACVPGGHPQAWGPAVLNGTEEIQGVLRELSGDLAKQKVRIAWADADLAKMRSESRDALALTREGEAQLTILAPARKSGEAELQRFVLRGRANISSVSRVKQFVDAYLAGTLRPVRIMKSEPVMSSAPDEDGLTTLVGGTFEAVAFDEHLDVFVLFFAPWCPKCQKILPTWTELAKRVKKLGYSDRGLVVAKMDATANECVEDVPGYPHFVFYPAVRGGEKAKMRRRARFTSPRQDVSTLLEFVEDSSRNLQEPQVKRKTTRCTKGCTESRVGVRSDL
eukprot:TRINITY_DN16747_c0_g1_i3.p1 TRINITY_DN16747_c0_g1~~TRINITY_DN16747_c0_g1_i3.p1  ORF type:complete len:716 (-),score=116.35 TRINITY_DN16747_c0_g1_i3:124-2154(-)